MDIREDEIKRQRPSCSGKKMESDPGIRSDPMISGGQGYYQIGGRQQKEGKAQKKKMG